MYRLEPFSYEFSKDQKSKKIFLKNILEFNKDEIIIISGPSGGGKSTFLKILKGIIPEYSKGKLHGEIFFKGKRLDGANFKKNVNEILYLFQNPFSQLIYEKTEEEFLFSMENKNFSKAMMDTQREKFEKVFNLEELWGKKTTNLSNGQCQKLILASLLAIDPSVLLLDEPTAFLDSSARLDFYNLINSVKKNKLVIMIDHFLEEAKKISDRIIYVTEDGEILEKEHIYNKKESFASFDFSKIGRCENIKMQIANMDYSHDKKTTLLKNINAVFHGGEVVAITGQNGVGKSTLFNLLAGVLTPQRGEIQTEIGGKKYRNKKNFSNISMIFQNPENHFFFDTIEEELNESFECSFTAGEKELLIKTFFNNLDLTMSPFLLSEGEKRRLSILMTVFFGKKIILYDEPTFGQDLNSIENISHIMKKLQELGFLQIMISHDDAFISNISDRIFLLKNGKLHEV